MQYLQLFFLNSNTILFSTNSIRVFFFFNSFCIKIKKYLGIELLSNYINYKLTNMKFNVEI